jgi:hypothetical protein
MIKIGFSFEVISFISRNQEAHSSNEKSFRFLFVQERREGKESLSNGHFDTLFFFFLLNRQSQTNFNLQIGAKETIEEITEMSNPYLSSFRMSIYS